MVVVAPDEAAKRADWIHVLTPDETQAEVYEQYVKPYLHPGKILGFSHGFSIHFKTIVPPSDVDVVMIAPKSPGHLLRRVYSEGRGVPSLIAIQQDSSKRAHEYALAYAHASARPAPVCCRPHSKKKLKAIFSASRPCCAAV